MLLRPPRSTRTDTLFPYATLFRSAVVLDQQVAAVGLAHLGHVAFFGAYLRQRLQLLRKARLPIEARLIGNDLLARAHVQELVETLGAERLLHGIDETDGELGMAVGEEAIRRRRQPPQLGRPTDRPRFGFVDRKSTRLNSRH